MKNLIAITAGEPESINSEIIAKTWNKIRFKNKLLIIGNYSLLKNQFKKLNFNLPLNLIRELKEFKKVKLNILDVKISNSSISKKKYILDCIDLAHKFSLKGKIKGFITAPINKNVLGKNFLGVTEYLAYKNKVKNKEIMLIYNKKLSVVPLTTHLEIKDIFKNITFSLIKNKIISLSENYKKTFKKNPRIALLGLNPHNSENKLGSVENRIVKPAIIYLKKKKINISGPYSSDTIFMKKNRKNFDVIVGMYHDQVLAPFKTLYEFDAINITLGLKYIRVSPDHGTASDLIGKNIATPQSLISAIKFLNEI
jgi:4-hydroxythreonine-4-phosphate dehydrogenase